MKETATTKRTRHYVPVYLGTFKSYQRINIREVYRGLVERGLRHHQARWAITLMLINTLPMSKYDFDSMPMYFDVLPTPRERKNK